MAGTRDPDASKRIHCKLQVARTKQIPAGQKRMPGTMDPEATIRFHYKLQAAMTLTYSDGDPGRARGAFFARRGPRGAPNFARQGNYEKRRAMYRRSNTPWAVGPANSNRSAHSAGPISEKRTEARDYEANRLIY